MASQKAAVAPPQEYWSAGVWPLVRPGQEYPERSADEGVDPQSRPPERHPYVFVLPARYAHLQEQLRAKGKWRYSDSRQKLIPKCNDVFGKTLGHANIDRGTFHDLRRRTISNWPAKGLSESEVMNLAGHSNFRTTHRFYLRVRDDMIDRARKASIRPTNGDLARAPSGE